MTDPAQLDNFRARIHADGRTERPPVKPPAVRSIAVPTTLSAGEFNSPGRLHRHGAAGEGELPAIR